MLSAYRPQLPPLFGKLPQELYREIYDCDPTYRSVFSSLTFADELERHVLRIHNELLNHLIKWKMQISNRYEEIITDYAIRLYPYRKCPGVMCFVLKPVNITSNVRNIPEPHFTWSGYIFDKNLDIDECMPYINFQRIDNLIVPSISKSTICSARAVLLP